MFAAILALLVMPFSDLSKLRGIQFRPLSKIAFYIFVANFLILMQLNALRLTQLTQKVIQNVRQKIYLKWHY